MDYAGYPDGLDDAHFLLVQTEKVGKTSFT